jgi:hypothetical protein
MTKNYGALLLFFISPFFSIHPFSSYVLLKNKSGHHILLIGNFNSPLCTTVNLLHTTLLLRYIEEADKCTPALPPTTCLTGISSFLVRTCNSDIALEQDLQTDVTGILLARTLYKNYHSLHFSLCDYEDNEAHYITGFLHSLKTFLSSLAPSTCIFQALQELQQRACKEFKGVTSSCSINTYLTSLSQKKDALKTIQEHYLQDPCLRPFFNTCYNTFTTALQEIKLLFTAQSSSVELELAILATFNSCTNVETAIQHYKHIQRLLSFNTSATLALAYYLHTILEHIQKQGKVIFMGGAYYTEHLQNILQSIGYTIVSTNTNVCSKQDPMWGPQYCLIPEARFLPQLLRAFEEILTTPATRKKFSCTVCGKDTISCCARCKTAYYCSKEHQHKHWQFHKQDCSPRQHE